MYAIRSYYAPDEQNEIVEKYSAEKENNAQIDHLGRRIYNKNSMLGIGINTGFTRFDTDAWPVRPGFNTALNTYIKLNPASAFNTDLSIGRSSSFYIDNFDYEAFSSYITFNFLPKERLSPNISLGYGIYHNKTSNLFNTESKYFTFFHTSYGFEYLIDRSFKINFGIKNRYFTNDLLDNTTHGKYNDMIWEGYCGVNYLFGTRWRKTSLFKRKSISYEKNN